MDSNQFQDFQAGQQTFTYHLPTTHGPLVDVPEFQASEQQFGDYSNNADNLLMPLSPLDLTFGGSFVALQDTPAGTQDGSEGYMPQASSYNYLYQPQPVPSSFYLGHGTQHTSSGAQQYNTYESWPNNSVAQSASLPQFRTEPQYQPEAYTLHANVQAEDNDFHLIPQAHIVTPSPKVSAAHNVHHGNISSSNVPGSSDTSQHGEIGSDDLRQQMAKPRSRHSKVTSTAKPFDSSSASSPDTGSKRPSGLFYSGFAEAEAAAFNRTRPTLQHDDWQIVKTKPAAFVQKLVKSFHEDYAQAPNQSSVVKDGDKTRWLAYQDSHIDKMAKYTDQTIEAACWVLVKHLVEAHEIGMKTLRYHKIENNITCSDHVDLVASVIRKYGVIRYDVARFQRLDELVCCTSSAVSRKIANFRGNWNKSERESENAAQAKAAGIKYVPVLGDKKRKAASSDESACASKARKLAPAPLTSATDVVRKPSTSSEYVPLKKPTSKKNKKPAALDIARATQAGSAAMSARFNTVSAPDHA